MQAEHATGTGGAVAVALPDLTTLAAKLDAADYIAGVGLLHALFLAALLPQPLLLEGEAGVGKTESAKAMAAVLGTPLIRLQCQEGLDAGEALYEWNYPRQLLGIRLAEAHHVDISEGDLFTEQYLIRRPVLEAIEHPGPLPAVLLIDEVDRADDDFEAFLLELLADAAVTIPELGTVRAKIAPVVLLTSNRTRDLHDALKRRCLYHWIDYPNIEQVVDIVRRRAPGAPARLAVEVAGTRIGESLAAFNDGFGWRGMARSAIIVIVSDGWEREDPDVVARNMERLARLAHRIVWVNPRKALPGYAPLAAGMAAALPHGDVFVSGHSLAALQEVVAAIGERHRPAHDIHRNRTHNTMAGDLPSPVEETT